MNARFLLIALSCLALGLAVSVAKIRREPSQPPTPRTASSPTESETTAPQSLRTESKRQNTNATPVALSWRQIESDDYRTYIANLRAVGCPDQTIRDIVLADINKLYAAREDPLKAGPKIGTNGLPSESAEQRLERLRQLRIVQQEKRETIKELLGVEIPVDMLPSSASRNYRDFEVALRFVPVEKRDAVQTLQETYWQQVDALRERYGKNRNAEFVGESRQLADNLRQELAKILSADELDDYDLRTSTTAKQLSDKLGAYFHPSEAEFRQIFKAKRDYDQVVQQLSTTPVPVPQGQAAQVDPKAAQEARVAAQTQMNERLKSGLGEERYSEYERSQDRTYDLLARLGVRYGLSQETVLQAYEAQKSFIPPSGPKQNTADLQKQLDERLTSILGDQAARGYRRVHGGTIPLTTKSP